MHLLSVVHPIRLLELFSGLSLTACAPLNSDMQNDLSTDPKRQYQGRGLPSP